MLLGQELKFKNKLCNFKRVPFSVTSIGYILLGFLAGLLLLTTFLGVGGSMIFLKQHQGLHSKKAPKGIFIFARSKSY